MKWHSPILYIYNKMLALPKYFSLFQFDIYSNDVAHLLLQFPSHCHLLILLQRFGLLTGPGPYFTKTLFNFTISTFHFSETAK